MFDSNLELFEPSLWSVSIIFWKNNDKIPQMSLCDQPSLAEKDSLGERAGGTELEQQSGLVVKGGETVHTDLGW